jgi:hypothetical protein
MTFKRQWNSKFKALVTFSPPPSTEGDRLGNTVAVSGCPTEGAARPTQIDLNCSEEVKTVLRPDPCFGYENTRG